MNKFPWIAMLVMVCVGGSASAGMFRWVDKDGKVHYSDQAPPTDVKSAEQKKISGNVIENSELNIQLQDAMKRNPATLYANNCGEICDKARNLLKTRGVPHADKNPETPEIADELKKLAGSLEVPTLKLGTKHIKGFEVGQWNTALDAAGYPKTSALRPSQAGKLVNPETTTKAPPPAPPATGTAPAAPTNGAQPAPPADTKGAR